MLTVTEIEPQTGTPPATEVVAPTAPPPTDTQTSTVPVAEKEGVEHEATTDTPGTSPALAALSTRRSQTARSIISGRRL